MNHPQPQKLSQDEWLTLAQKSNLSEAEHQVLLASLPEDPKERQNWLNELSLAMALHESAQKNPEWIRNIFQNLKNNKPSGAAKKTSRLWPKALAATAVAALMLMLIERPKEKRLINVPVKEQEVQKIASSTPSKTEESTIPTETRTMIQEDKKAVAQDIPQNSLNDTSLQKPETEGQIALASTDSLVKPLEVASDKLDMIKEIHPEMAIASPVAVKEVEVQKTEALNEMLETKPELMELLPVANISSDVSNIAVVGLTGHTSSARSPTAVAGVRATPYALDMDQSRTEAHVSLSKSKLRRDTPPTKSTSTETYAAVVENAFINCSQDRQSTFSIDVDTASYSNIRRIIRGGQMPPADAVRVEEMINYFDYNYPQAKSDEPFSVTMDMGDCPWNSEHRLLRVGLKGRVDLERPKVNLVFLLDVSGSMMSADKLPLLKQSFKLLIKSLNQNDRVGIVAYAGHTGVVLDPTPASQREKIAEAIDQLVAQGSTNGVGGIQLAYQLAQQSFEKGAVNRVILATDGDFNVGISNQEELQKFIEEQRKTGIELSVLGFGKGNIRDDLMETLANKGNGNYTYIDTLREARKALVGELNSNLVTIAKDVKIQMEFNPEVMQSFRLVGYENRKLAHQDFADDTKDAGEMGMGHTVTALYELVPQPGAKLGNKAAELRLRYKKPQGDVSSLLTHPVLWNPANTDSADFQWAVATASWGQILKGSPYVNNLSLEKVIQLARQSRGADANGYRAEMIQLMEQSQDLMNSGSGNVKLPRWKVE